MQHAVQPGITPPAPGLDREEPEFNEEEDIPTETNPEPMSRNKPKDPEKRGSHGVPDPNAEHPKE